MEAAKIIRFHAPDTHFGAEPQTREAHEIIEDYLDHLCGPLVGIVPYARRSRLRQEARYDIQERAALYERDGLEPEDAAEKAVSKYGDTGQLSESFIEEWMNGLPKGALARKIGLPMSYAAFFFTQAYLWGLILLQYRFFFPGGEPLNIGITIPQLRTIYPEPLPLPEQNFFWGFLWIYGFVAPVAAGWLTGRYALTGAARSAITVQVLAIILTFVVGTFMLPVKDGLLFALLQIVWWIPVGTLTAHIVSALTRRRRFRFQPVLRKKSNET